MWQGFLVRQPFNASIETVLQPIIIEDVRPRTPSGRFPAKAVVGESVHVSASIYKDGHDVLAARLHWRAQEGQWAPMKMEVSGDDRWEAVLVPEVLGRHEFKIEAWPDVYATWAHKARAKATAGQDIALEMEEGASFLEARAASVSRTEADRLRAAAKALLDTHLYNHERFELALSSEVLELVYGPPDERVSTSEVFELWVDRKRALVGAWYELFPRSEGGFRGVSTRLPAIADMGFDVLYLPPIHPIGRSFRKGRNNTLSATEDDPGSPWAIGSEEGGHIDIHPDLGTLDDFHDLVSTASDLGVEVALDYALQCSPDHPWVKKHPEWFHHRADGTIAYAENPPKKYQDIYPINFWPDKDSDREALWHECKSILDYWIDQGIKIFRVDNPHTKPFPFWAWLIAEVQAAHPDVIFLSEAFTKPAVMLKLAEIGFTQSYTYFTWRTTRDDLTHYVTELAHGPSADYFRPNFWTNTQDILSGPLRGGSAAVFKSRLLLAATLVPSYGMYSGFELCENEWASTDNEEYLHSEKYEIKERNWETPESLAPFITKVNEFRRQHPAFDELRNIRFHGSTNSQILVYSKQTADHEDVVLIIVSLDPDTVHESTLELDLELLGINAKSPYKAYDHLSGESFVWKGPFPYVKLDPSREPAHLLHLRSQS